MPGGWGFGSNTEASPWDELGALLEGLSGKGDVERIVLRWDPDVHRDVDWDGSHRAAVDRLIVDLRRRFGATPSPDAGAALRPLFVLLMAEQWWRGEHVVRVAATFSVDLARASLSDRLAGLPRAFRVAGALVLVAAALLWGWTARNALGPVEIVVVECSDVGGVEVCTRAPPLVRSDRRPCDEASARTCLRCARAGYLDQPLGVPSRPEDPSQPTRCGSVTLAGRVRGTVYPPVHINRPPVDDAAPSTDVCGDLDAPRCVLNDTDRIALNARGYDATLAWLPADADQVDAFTPAQQPARAPCETAVDILAPALDRPGLWRCHGMITHRTGVERFELEGAVVAHPCTVHLRTAGGPLPATTFGPLATERLLRWTDDPDAADVVATARRSGEYDEWTRAWTLSDRDRSTVHDPTRTIAADRIQVFEDLVRQEARFLRSPIRGDACDRLCVALLTSCGGFVDPAGLCDRHVACEGRS